MADKVEVKDKDISIVRQGTQIIMPPGMSYDEGIVWLGRKKEEEEAVVALHEEFHEGYVLDVARAFTLALKDIYGWVGLEPTPGFFGSTPPCMIGVKIDAQGNTIQIPWGRMAIPNVVGHLETGITQHEGRFIFVLKGRTKRRHMVEIQRIVDKTRELAKEQSIYKGKALRLKKQDPDEEAGPFNGVPEFLDVTGVREAELIFPEDIARMVEVALFTPIRNTAACRAHGVPLKRGILLEGPYGTGKSMTARVTAKVAQDHGWTYVLVEDTADLVRALQFAKNYMPAVVFTEDIDRADAGDRGDSFNQILNTLDGVELKGAEIITILTTNHIERIHRSMLRPGRLDAVVPVRPPDHTARIRLIQLYARNLLAPGQDLAKASDLLDGTIPAVIREVVERAKLAAISRGESPLKLVASDLEISAQGMMAHLNLLKEEAEVNPDRVEKALRTIGEAMTH